MLVLLGTLVLVLRCDLAVSHLLRGDRLHFGSVANDAEERKCSSTQNQTTITNGILLYSKRPVANFEDCEHICRTDVHCNSFMWHKLYNTNGLENETYSRRCSIFKDTKPTTTANIWFTLGLCDSVLDKWGCEMQEKTLTAEKGVQSKLNGHAAFEGVKGLLHYLSKDLLENRTVLHIGYGDAPSSIIFRGFNSTIYATEEHFRPWMSSLDGPFYDDLLADVKTAMARGELPKSFNFEKASEFSNNCGTTQEGSTLLQTGMERLAGVPSNSIDVSYSISMLQFIGNVRATFASLARVMNVGGLSCNQIDFRDQRDVKRPLDFFLDDDGYNKNKKNHQNVNRLRFSELMSIAKRYAFQTVFVNRNHEPYNKADSNYTEETLRALRKCKNCSYKDWPREDFDGCTSNKMLMTGVFWCVRYLGVHYLGAESTDIHETPKCGQDEWSHSNFTLIPK